MQRLGVKQEDRAHLPRRDAMMTANRPDTDGALAASFEGHPTLARTAALSQDGLSCARQAGASFDERRRDRAPLGTAEVVARKIGTSIGSVLPPGWCFC